MKVQILQLKDHDDDISAREKLSWVKADRAVLVWPRRGQLLQRRLDLQLLRRKAEQQGVELGLVTHDPVVRDHAARLHIPVFASVDRLPEPRWSVAEERRSPARRAERDEEVDLEPPDVPSRRPGRELSSGQRMSIFTLGAAAVLSLLATFLPSATLIVTPQTQNQSVTWQAELDPGLELASPESSRIPARVVRTEVSGSLRLETSGLDRRPSSVAQGEVVFRNLTDEPQAVPAGTSVWTSDGQPRRFVTLERVLVPAGSDGQAEVEVEAAEPGPAGNVSPGRIDAIDGELGLVLEVNNPRRTRGGASTYQPAVTNRDVERLRSELMSQLLDQGTTSMRAELRAGQGLAASSLRIDRVVEESYDRQPGEIAASVALDMTLQASALAYDSGDLRTLAAARVPQHQPPGWALIPGSLAVQINQTTGDQDEAVVLHLAATWTSFKSVPKEEVRELAAGANARTVSGNLEQAYDLEDLQVRASPDWLPRLPWVAARIYVLYPWQMQ